MFARVETFLTGNHDSLSSSVRDVTYSCGACGYALNLSSSNRITSQIDSKYGKAIRKGFISFFSVDESRFTQIDELRCLPSFIVQHSWGLFRPRTKLLCRKCGSYIGHAYEESTPPFVSDKSDSSSGNGNICRKYNIKIRSVQPSSDDSAGSCKKRTAS